MDLKCDDCFTGRKFVGLSKSERMRTSRMRLQEGLCPYIAFFLHPLNSIKSITDRMYSSFTDFLLADQFHSEGQQFACRFYCDGLRTWEDDSISIVVLSKWPVESLFANNKYNYFNLDITYSINVKY
jgi:hypothetical protein